MQNLVAAPAIVAEERREGQQPGSYPHQVCIEAHLKHFVVSKQVD